ncbi:MAG: glycosyltransferase family 2 protein [Candidatus Methanoperedens sp.]|nr:glycosyltransferase family 2 protein [Candidatus Methanoperedens sp.]
MSENTISVIIPCMNEEKTIGKCIQKARAALKKEGLDGEIIVSDNSTDRSREIAQQMGAKVVIPMNRGYGNAYMEGVRYAKGKFLLFADADNTYDLHEMPRLLRPLIEGKADFVMGTRLKGGIKTGSMPWLHRYIGNPMLTWILNMLFHTRISDTHCGMRAIRHDSYLKLDMKSEGMEYASEMIIEAARKKLRMTEVPVTYYPRITPSKLHSWGDGWRHLRFMMLYNPTPFLFIPGLLVFLMGIFLISALLLRGNVETTGLNSFILGSMLVIIGTQMIATGSYMKIYGIIHNKIDKTGITAKLLDYHSLEVGLLLGIVLLTGGIITGADIIYKWVSSGYWELSEVGNAVIAMVLAALGTQIIFSTLIVSIFILDRKDNQ